MGMLPKTGLARIIAQGNPMKHVRQSEFARQQGFSRQYVRKLINSGIVALETDGRIDPAKAKNAIDAIRNPAKNLQRKGRPADPVADPAGDASLNQLLLRSRIKESVERSYVAELRRKEREGELVDVAAMERLWAITAQTVRDGLLSLPELLAHELAAITDPAQVRDRLRAGFVKLLQELPERIHEAVASQAV